MTVEKEPRPVVSVVMPAHNSARTLRQSAASVLDQTCADLELIIVDDGSFDASAQIAHAISASDARVRVIRRARSGGPAAARNSALASALGRYVAFCDSDDLWLPAKLERQVELSRQTGAALVYSGYYKIDADFSGSASEHKPQGRVVRVPRHLTHADLLRANVVGCLTAMVDVEQTGPLSMLDIPGAEDWALWLRVLRETGPGAGIDEPLALYRSAQPGSHSARRWRATRAVWRVLREQEGLSAPSAAAHLATDAIAALRKNRI